MPPENSNDVLALTIQPIVYFLVLCSIIVHGSSIPFFNLGKRVHTVTRTWTNRSESEPSWLARVKRVGDNGNADLPTNPEKMDDEKAAERRRREQDLEAGRSSSDSAGTEAIDDPGMDTGDFSARDYATGYGMKASRHSSGASGSAGQKISPTASSDRTAMETGSGEQSGSKLPKKESGKAASHRKEDQDDHRRERHDESSSDSDEEWDEGNDIVIDHHHGEDVEVRHKGKGNEEASRPSSAREGPGFPGHRFSEIEKMLSGAGRSDSLDENEAEDENEDEDADDRQEESSSSRKPLEHDDLVHEASRRVAGKQIADEKAASDAKQGKSKTTSQHGESATEETETVAAEPKRPEMSKGKSILSAQRLASMTGLARPQPKRKPSLTPEEKLARDAWCRKERKDVDDDQVKTWISGKHIVLERNNGEDVEIIDVNPSKEAREKAKKSSNVNMRELPIQDVQEAKEDIAKERRTAAESSSSVGHVQQQSSKRFDLKSFRQNQSFKKLFGGEEGSDSRGQAASSTSRTVPTIMEDAPEDEAEALALPQAASSSNDSAMPSIMRQHSNVPPTEDSENRSPFSSTRRTGIPVERTETTDSQVRFGNLPRPSRK